MLKIEHLSIEVNQVKLLENINLTIKDGDIVCILGQNGQGKSTLLKTIMGLHNYLPSHGTIFYNNQKLNDLDVTARASLGIFLANQNPIEIDGVLLLDFYKAILQTTNKKMSFVTLYKNIENILKLVKLPNDFLQRYVNVGFSGGEKKKNEIVQMLLLEPDLILLDEIDSGLDLDTTQIIFEIIKQQIANHKTVVYVSHSKEMIETIKPNVVILIHNHKIVTVGGIELGHAIIQNGYKKTLATYGIRETKETLDVCINEHFKK